MGQQIFGGAAYSSETDAGVESGCAIAPPQSAIEDAQARTVSRDVEGGMRVFIVDDNEDVAMLMAEALELKGHVTSASFDAVTALRVISQFSPDVILLDIGLPIINGYELAQKLRQMPE
ncbi:MAG TPA: response regulator, partial [Candidatus Binataceae bacterium]|nr:response regulator [Candidatus Binataceae bacterium]